MKHHFIIVFLVVMVSSSFAQEKSRKVYVFNPGYLKGSMRHEIGFSFGTHVAKSPMKDKFYSVSNSVAYPEPVFSRTIGLATLTYEPKLRLLEFGSNASFSLDIPLTASFSLGDVLTASGDRFDATPITSSEFDSGVYSKRRENVLGGTHVEVGALASINLFQGATLENTSLAGLSVSGGLVHVVSPLIMNITSDYERDVYSDFLQWTTAVGRVGLHLRAVVFYYTFGVNPTIVTYRDPSGDDQRERVNTYNRFSISFRLGR